MKKKIQSFLILAFALISLIPLSVNATHTAGMDMFYRHTTDSSYEFTLVFYRNCQGFTAGAPQTVTIQGAAQSVSLSTSLACVMLPTWGTGVPPLEPPNIFNCTNDLNFCLEEYVYRGTWTSPKRASDWKFNYSLCCMPNTNAPANVQNGTQYNECSLNNLDFPDYIHKNRSPFWHNRRPNHPGYTTDTIFNPANVSICQGRNVLLNQSTREYDGDIVKYELIWVPTNAGMPIAYINGYSFPNPLPTVGGPFSIDSLTGAINFRPGVPTGTGIYVIGIRAREYRMDSVSMVLKEIGYVSRNLFIIIEDSASCADSSFTFSGTSSSSSSPASLIEIDCPQQIFNIRFTQQFKCESADTNGTCFELRKKSNMSLVPITKVQALNCISKDVSNKLEITTGGIITADTFLLMVKTGTDSNTLVTECFTEIEAYKDTLTIVFLEEPIGDLLGDKISQGVYDNKISIECGKSSFKINLSEPAACNSVAVDGSDFVLVDNNVFPPNYIAPSSATKACNHGRTSSIELRFSTMNAGLYTLYTKNGSDGNSLQNICGVDWLADSLPVVVSGLDPDLGPDITYCLEDPFFHKTLYPGDFISYLWSTSGTNPQIVIQDSGTYYVTVWNIYGCQETDTIEVKGIYCYLGLDDLNNASGIKVFPNPTTGQLFMEYDQWSGDEMISIYNISGEKLTTLKAEFGNALQKVSMHTYESGIYFIQVTKGDEILFENRVVKY